MTFLAPTNIQELNLSFFDEPKNKSRRPTRAEKRKARQVLRDEKRYQNIPQPMNPKNLAQKEFLECLRTEDFTVVLGPAGCGKTYVASRYALELLLNGVIDKIITTRPLVGVSNEEIGFLPGGIKDKTLPWSIPLMDAFKDGLGGSKEKLDKLLKEEKIEFVPFQFVRGRTFNNTFMILDEAQNTTVEQIKAFTTRVGENTKVVITGDLQQTDLKGKSGIKYLVDVIDRVGVDCAAIFEFDERDVVRSKICSEFVNAFKEYEDIYS